MSGGALRVGVVGCGAVTQRMYARVLLGLPGVVTTHVSDLDEAVAVRVAAILDARVVSLEALIESVDIVIVATPPGTHSTIVAQALERGRTVLCEKPFVGRRADAERLVHLAEARGAGLYVGHFRRLFPAVAAARELVATGALGAVKDISAIEGGRFSWETVSGYVNRDPLGGVLFDTGSHLLDTALFVSGWDGPEVTVQVGAVTRDRPEPAHEIEGQFTLSRPDGSSVGATVRLSRFESLANRIQVVLERGTLDISAAPRPTFRLTGPDGTCLIRVGDSAPDYEGCFADQLRRILRPGGDPVFAGRRFVGLTGLLESLAGA